MLTVAGVPLACDVVADLEPVEPRALPAIEAATEDVDPTGTDVVAVTMDVVEETDG